MKRLLLLLALVPAPALAQGGANANSAVGSVASTYRQAVTYIAAAAEQMPEVDFAFKPTPDVRSFGQLVGHVANAQFMICAAALGETSPATQNYEQVTDKAAIIEGLRASNALCDRAYAMSDETAMQVVQLFGQERTRLAVLVLNAAHDFEHYGNLVTYLRLKGMVPPSSQGD
jgi:uncharacterized damage-inducible protein DinB